MTEKPPFAIRKVDSNVWLHTAIDSSGMDVFWVSISHCDHYNSREDAENFLQRVKERYPNEKMEIVPYARD